MDINLLFQPAQSGVSPGNPGVTPAVGTWFAQLLANANTLQLPTSSWQSGGVVRTILAICSQMMAQEDVIVSIMAQGGFLDYAATGTVSTTAANGQIVTQPVTPDPSIQGQNPTGAAGWLDVLASSVYNVQRIGAQYASNTLAIANTTANTYGPYVTGTFHVSNPSSGAGYSNTSSLTIGPASIAGGAITAASNTAPITITTSGVHGLSNTSIVLIAGVLGNTAANGFWTITVVNTTQFILNGSLGSGAWTSGGTVNICTQATFAADVAGPGGTSALGTITQTTTVLSGVSCSNPASFYGQTWESNAALAARCRLKLQSLSPNGSAGAYKYFALSASQILAAQTPPVQLASAINRVLVTTSATTGVVTTTIASASGAVAGVSNLAITGATNATPIVITTTSPHGLTSGNFVTISGVLGTTIANGTWNITVTGASTFSLTGSAGNAAYTGGGFVDGGDLGEVDSVIQANCVPDDITAITQSATGFNVAIAATVTVPQAQVILYQVAAQAALVSYFAQLAIGGIGSGILSYNDMIGVLFSAGVVGGLPSYVVNVTNLTVNGGTVDVTYPTNISVAVLSPTPVLTVIGT